MKPKKIIAYLALGGFVTALSGSAFAQSATRTQLVATPSPSKAARVVTMIADVDGLGGGAPRGSVSFSVGDLLGMGVLRVPGAGQAAFGGIGYHNCGLSSAGGVQCWGWNTFGQLGDGTTVDQATSKAVVGLASGVIAVGAGVYHSCALTDAGAVKCWGNNASGQLGDGTVVNRLTPVTVTGLPSGVTALAIGAEHSCALNSNGAVFCWGKNTSGQLGDGTTIGRNFPGAVLNISGVVAIAAGVNHTCAIISGGAIRCWGYNFFGQVGDGTTTNKLAATPVSGIARGGTALALGSFHSCAIVIGAVKCWGNNANGQLGDGTTVAHITPGAVPALVSGVATIAVGNDHSCALTAAGGMRCWGANFFGQVGDGTTVDRLVPTPVAGLGSGVAAISGGIAHTCAILNASVNNTRCWGDNQFGQVGDGTTTSRQLPVIASFLSLVRSRARLNSNAIPPGPSILNAFYEGSAAHTTSTGTAYQTVQP